MNTEWLTAFIAFGFATAGTPGPNNLILAAAGANHGLRHALPGVFGVSLGFAFMIAAAGLGLAEIFSHWPWLADVLRWAGTAFLLWLAYSIATATPAAPGKAAGNAAQAATPPGFLRMAAFQWVNPKAWSMVLAMMGVYAGHNLDYRTDMLIMAALFAGIGTITALSWALLGVLAGHVLSPSQLLWFNRIMALLLVASLALIWI